MEGRLNIGPTRAWDKVLDVKLEIVGWMFLDRVVGGSNLELFDLSKFVLIGGDD